MPLLYRDAPLNSIWEGSGNVAALDVLRAMVKEPEGLPAFLAECELAAGADAAARRAPGALRERVTQLAAATATAESAFTPPVPARADRRGPRGGAAGLAARAPRPAGGGRRVLRRRGWTATGGRVYGTLPAGVDAEAIIERALPA